MSQLLLVAGVILVALVAYAQGAKGQYDRGYKAGWDAFAKRLQEESRAHRSVAGQKAGTTVHRLPPSPPEPWI